MKGIVFTEFLEMVEEKFGYQMVDQIIEGSDLESEGIYTGVGTYDHSEIVQLLTNLSTQTETDPDLLLKEFGKFLFNTFLRLYPRFFEEADNVFSFLESIDTYIHVEVQKLYPDATLPRFNTEMQEDGSFKMIYESERKMSALAEGLISSTIRHYDENLTIERELLNEEGSKVKFTIREG